MAKYYKFLVHLGNDTYHNIMLGNQLTVMSDVEKPEMPPVIDNITLELNIESTEVFLYCQNNNNKIIDISIKSLWISTSSADYDETDFKDWGWFTSSIDASDADQILGFDDSCVVEEVSIFFTFSYNGTVLGELSVRYGG